MKAFQNIKNRLQYFAMAGVVWAQSQETGTINLAPTDENFAPLANITAGSFVSAAIRIVLIIAALVALFFLIFGGIKWITSSGDKGQVESARNTVTAALIGLLIVFAAWALIQLINFFFGINVLEFTLPQFATGT